MRPKITKGADFSITVQIVTEPYVEGLLIKSSTVANPSVIETILPHQLATNDRVRISGHRRNTAINGKRTVTAIDPLTFSVGVAGSVVGDNTGRVSKCVNIADYVFTVKCLNQHGGTEYTTAVPTLTVLTEADGEYKIEIPKEKTALLTVGTCVIQVTYVDTDSKTRIRSIECEVANA